MKKFILIFYSVLLIFNSAFSQNLQWAKQISGDGIGNASLVITIDASENVYTIGSFAGTVDFDPGSGVFNLTATGNSDIFINKLDASGNFVWVKSFGGPEYDTGRSIVLDSSGNIYTTGTFGGTADFDPGLGVYNLTTSGIADGVFISKLDASGNFVWAKKIGGGCYCDYYFIAVDGTGNVYTTGSFDGTQDFDPGPGVFNLTSTGWSDTFISKLDSAGNFVWAKRIGGVDICESHSIVVD